MMSFTGYASYSVNLPIGFKLIFRFRAQPNSKYFMFPYAPSHAKTQARVISVQCV